MHQQVGLVSLHDRIKYSGNTNTDIQTDSRTAKLTNSHTDGNTYMQKHRQTDIHADTQTQKVTNIRQNTDRHISRQTDGPN